MFTKLIKKHSTVTSIKLHFGDDLGVYKIVNHGLESSGIRAV
jgi:hypothetical protein